MLHSTLLHHIFYSFSSLDSPPNPLGFLSGPSSSHPLLIGHSACRLYSDYTGIMLRNSFIYITRHRLKQEVFILCENLHISLDFTSPFSWEQQNTQDRSGKAAHFYYLYTDTCINFPSQSKAPASQITF